MKKNIINISDSNLKELHQKFGYSGIGYYYKILEEISLEENYLYPKSKLNKLSRKTKISKKIIEKLIKTCTNIYNTKGFPLLSENKKYFWSNGILFTVYNNKQLKNKCSGRKKISKSESIKLKEAELVNLTQEQLERLQNRYGHIFIHEAIKLLNNWLKLNTKKTNFYKNRNNYWLFRRDSWLIRETRLKLESI